MKKYTKNAVFSELKKYDPVADKGDFIEVTEWKNGDGFDVEIVGKLSTRFQLTWGEFEALKELVEKLEDTEDGLGFTTKDAEVFFESCLTPKQPNEELIKAKDRVDDSDNENNKYGTT